MGRLGSLRFTLSLQPRHLVLVHARADARAHPAPDAAPDGGAGACTMSTPRMSGGTTAVLCSAHRGHELSGMRVLAPARHKGHAPRELPRSCAAEPKAECDGAPRLKQKAIVPRLIWKARPFSPPGPSPDPLPYRPPRYTLQIVRNNNI